MNKGYCEHGDRDVPSILCGYPLPCPYHTVILDTTTEPPCVKIPAPRFKEVDLDTLEKLKKIARIMEDD